MAFSERVMVSYHATGRKKRSSCKREREGPALMGPPAGLQVRRFRTLAEYSRTAHQEEHSVMLDFDIS